MNQSKKILAALVAIPASVVVADGAMAAEATLNFEIKNEFVGQSVPNVNSSITAVPQLTNSLLEQMNNFKENFTLELDVTDESINQNKLAYAQKNVTDVIDYLKANLNNTLTIPKPEIDHTVVYGLMNNMKVRATEVKNTSGVVTKVKLDFTVSYLADSTYKEKLVDIVFGQIKENLPSIESASSLMKVKAVHDYLITKKHVQSTGNNLNNINSTSDGMSAHTYSIYTYLLLKKLKVETNYVYGLSRGEFTSWNLVKLDDDKWYQIDVAGNDNIIKGSKEIKYYYFLTGDDAISAREIYFGNEDNYSINTSFSTEFVNMVNPLVDETHFYYSNSSENGQLYKLSINPGAVPKKIGGAFSSPGLFVKPGKTVYLINTQQGNNIYTYETDPLKLGFKANVESFKIDGLNFTFKISGETVSRTFSLDIGLEKGIANYVASEIKKIEIKSVPDITEPYRNQVLAMRKLYNILTDTQKIIANQNMTETIEGSTDTRLAFLEKSILSTEGKVNLAIAAINKIDITESTFFIDVQNAKDLLADLTPTEEKSLYNINLLIEANKLISEMESLEVAIQNFYNKNINLDEEERDANFYHQVKKLLDDYYKLHPTLKRASFAGTIAGLEGFGNNVAAQQKIVEIRNKLSLLHVESIEYIKNVEKIKEEYETLKVAQKGLLTEEEKNTIEGHITQMTEMQKVVDELKKYVEDINKIDNTANPPEPEELKVEFINKIKQVKKLLDTGIKPSQWDALKSATPSPNVATLAQFTEEVTKFLARVEAEQNGLSTKAIAVREELIGFETIFPTKLEEMKYENIAAYVTEIESLISRLEGTDFAGSSNNLQLIFLMITDPNVLKIWERHTSLKDNLQTAVTTFNAEISTHTTTPLTEVKVEALLKQYNEADIIFKHFAKDAYDELQEIKTTLDEKADQEKATALATKMSALVFKEQNSKNATYEEAELLWKEYESGSEAFKKVFESESAKTSLANFTALWNTLKAEEDAKQADEQKIKDLIEEIKALVDKTDVTKEEVEAVKAKLENLTLEQLELVTNANDLEKLLAALEEKEKEKQDALDKADADAVIKMIAELTDESTPTEITAVRAAFDALSENAKKLVAPSTVEILTYYEERIKELNEIAEKEAAVVQDRITRITSSYTEAQIKNIRIAFNALSELAKTYVTNLQKLIDAENNVIYQNTVVKQAKLDANAFDVYMNDINRNSTTAQIAQARAFYNRLSAEARKHVTTYEKLVRLETMWKDPEYLDLVFTYYPEYIHEVKPGAIVVQKPTYDPLYIPDDSAPTLTPTSPSVATNPVASWSAYETMRFQNGRYTTAISSTQVKNNTDRNMRLKADNIEIVIPTADLKASTATVGVSVNVTNNQLNIQFTEGNNAKYFSDYVEIHVPFSALKGNASQIIERVAASDSAASFKVDGSTFIIRTKSSGTFKATTARTYNDIPAGAQGDAIRELAKRGIQFDTSSRLSQSYKQVTKMDVALMIATALDLSSNAKSKYQDLESDVHVKRAQGLLEAGIMSGATSSSFNSNGTITKQEAAIIIANMYRYLNQDLAKAYNNLNSSYRDVAGLTLEAQQSIAILELFDVVSGTGSFEPTKQLTRGEFAEIIYKALTAIDYL